MNLNQITVPSLNVQASIEFYQKLGLKLIVHTHARYARFECPDGESTFSIHEVAQLPKGEGIYVYFECKDLDQRVEHLIQGGVEFEDLPKNQTWLWREARLRDPDGNQLDLYWAGDNRKNPPWRKR